MMAYSVNKNYLLLKFKLQKSNLNVRADSYRPTNYTTRRL